MRRAAFGAALFLALFLVLAFLTLPIVAIFVHTSPRELINSLGEPGRPRRPLAQPEDVARRAGDHRHRRNPRRLPAGDAGFRGRSIVVTLIELPLVLPPAVAGIALLACLRPRRACSAARWTTRESQLVLQTAGVIVALTFVAAPFYLRQAQEAFAAVDRNLLDAARTLGASEAQSLRPGRECPCAGQGITSGLALAWGRALGEFGATLMFAGSFPGITQTVPLAIFARFSTDFTVRPCALRRARDGLRGAAALGEDPGTIPAPRRWAGVSELS